MTRGLQTSQLLALVAGIGAIQGMNSHAISAAERIYRPTRRQMQPRPIISEEIRAWNAAVDAKKAARKARRAVALITTPVQANL